MQVGHPGYGARLDSRQSRAARARHPPNTIKPMWEGRALRDITEADIRQLVDSGLHEHLQLEYKSALYSGNHHDTRESLLDICQFANAAGGILLIGVPERRDTQDKPTGAPDPNAQLGIAVPNPDATLLALDARVVANVEDRLVTESFAVPITGGLHVLAIRVPNSQSKPHSVHLDSHIYFPSRRERHRYYMDVREIKEMVMRTASRLEEAERKLTQSFLEVPRDDDQPRLFIGCIPVFWRDFMLNVRKLEVSQAANRFDLADDPPTVREVKYNFTGLERPIGDAWVQVRRNGLIVLHWRVRSELDNSAGVHRFIPSAIDVVLRHCVLRSAAVYQAAELPGPYLVGMLLRLRLPLAGYHLRFPGTRVDLGTMPVGDHLFPTMQVDNLTDVDKTILPLCDQAHQMFGQEASPCFNRQGEWVGPR